MTVSRLGSITAIYSHVTLAGRSKARVIIFSADSPSLGEDIKGKSEEEGEETAEAAPLEEASICAVGLRE